MAGPLLLPVDSFVKTPLHVSNIPKLTYKFICVALGMTCDSLKADLFGFISETGHCFDDMGCKQKAPWPLTHLYKCEDRYTLG